MNLKNIGSRVQQAVQATAKKAVENVKAEAARPMPQTMARFQFGDAFVTCSARPNQRVDLAGPKGIGASAQVGGHQYGVHFKAQDGAARLGSISVEARGREVVFGLVPAAPSPLPMVVYSGVDRDGEG